MIFMNETKNEVKIVKINFWTITTIILIVVLIGLTLFEGYIKEMLSGYLTPEDTAKKVVEFINKNLVQPNETVTFVSVKEFDNLYNISISYMGQTTFLYATKDGNYLFLSQPLDIKELTKPEEVIGNFLKDKETEICKENDKPIVYFFGSEKCPHCKWEHPIIANITEKFKGQISYHENIDTDKDNNVFLKYSSSGSIPTIVIGCKYYRIGSGETLGEEQESKVLTALICKVTGNEPSDVCSTVEDLISQVP
jgi:thiol-disulfide isomerase/thioredoxin